MEDIDNKVLIVFCEEDQNKLKQTFHFFSLFILTYLYTEDSFSKQKKYITKVIGLHTGIGCDNMNLI